MNIDKWDYIIRVIGSYFWSSLSRWLVLGYEEFIEIF